MNYGQSARGESYRDEHRVSAAPNRLALQEMDGPTSPSQPTLRERVYQVVQHSQREANFNQRRYERALKCAQLIEAHPEVAELVELLREF